MTPLCTHARARVHTHYQKSHLKWKNTVFLKVAVLLNKAVCGQTVLEISYDCQWGKVSYFLQCEFRDHCVYLRYLKCREILITAERLI